MNSVSTVGRWACALGMGWCLALVPGCGAEPDGGAQEEAEAGSVVLELTSAPSDVKCLRLTVRNAVTEQVAVRSLALTTNQSSAKFPITGLPLGAVTLLAEGFNLACASLVETTPLTWTSDLVSLNLASGFTQSALISLRRAGSTNLGVDFVAGAQMEEIASVPSPYKLVAAPSGGGVIVLTSNGAVTRVTSAGVVTNLANAPGSSASLAVTSTGNIAVVSTAGFSVFGATGVLRAQLPLSDVPSDLAIDSTNSAWIALRNVNRIVRVTGIEANALVRTDVFVPGPQSAAAGLATVADSARWVGSGVPRMLAFAPTGALLWDQPLGPAGQGLRDVIVASDASLWGVGPDGRVFRSNADGTLTQPVPQPGPNGGGEFFLASSAKGVVLARGEGVFYRFDPAQPVAAAPLVYSVPSSGAAASIGGLAFASDGRLFLADRANNRIIAATLP